MDYLVCGMVHIKEFLLLAHEKTVVAFLSRYLRGPLSYVLIKCVE